MRNYPLKLDGYELSREEYFELYWFCRQYPDKKLRASLMISAGNQALSGMPHNPNPSDPVYNATISREKLLKDCEMIEQAAIAAAPEMYQAILRSVTMNEPFSQINPPCGINQFTMHRRKFYFLLRERRAAKS
jgi:hypothetical protein